MFRKNSCVLLLHTPNPKTSLLPRKDIICSNIHLYTYLTTDEYIHNISEYILKAYIYILMSIYSSMVMNTQHHNKRR